MRMLVVTLCSLCALAVAGSAAWAGEPTAGTLSVERGKGVVMVDIRGSLLGRLGTGSIRVTDTTPTDKYTALVVGRKLQSTRLGPRTVVYRGVGLRFRMLGGGFKVVVRGGGISLSAVGKGTVVLDGEPRYTGDDTGVYSFDGVDCSLEAAACTPLPSEPERFALEPAPDEPKPARSAS